ncbi:MAG: hypothetical protein ABSB19_10665 [Methylomonas sp.]|jgi:hypothetical protein
MHQNQSKPDNQGDLDLNSPAHANHYPSARYFQIHFEHLQEQINRLQNTLEVLQKQVLNITVNQVYLDYAEKKPQSHKNISGS